MKFLIISPHKYADGQQVFVKEYDDLQDAQGDWDESMIFPFDEGMSIFGQMEQELGLSKRNELGVYYSEMPRHLSILILDAVKTMGSYDPNEILFIFEENLTFEEHEHISGFLEWVHATNKGFGRANIDTVWSAYWEQKGIVETQVDSGDKEPCLEVEEIAANIKVDVTHPDGSEIELGLIFEPSANAFFAVESSFLEQMDDEGMEMNSPYNAGKLCFSDE